MEVMCEAAGLSLSTCNYLAQHSAADSQPFLRITELALERCRKGLATERLPLLRPDAPNLT